jgi:hypothetical protein
MMDSAAVFDAEGKGQGARIAGFGFIEVGPRYTADIPAISPQKRAALTP